MVVGPAECWYKLGTSPNRTVPTFRRRFTWAGLVAVSLHPCQHLAGRYDPVPGFGAPRLRSAAGVVGSVDGVLVVGQHVHYLVVPHHLKCAHGARRHELLVRFAVAIA